MGLRTGDRRVTRILLGLSLAAPLVLARGFLFPFVIPKVFYFQTLLAMALGLLAVTWTRNRGQPLAVDRCSLRSDLFFWLFLSFAVLAAFAALCGDSVSKSLLGTLERRWGVLTWTSFLGFYLLLRVHLNGDGWKRVLQVMAAVAAAVSLYGLCQAAGLWPGRAEPAGWSRISATLGNPGYLAAYLVVSASLTGYWVLRRSEGWRRGLWLAALAVQGGALLLTGTRAVVLGISVAVFVVAGAWFVLAPSRRLQWAAVGGMTLVVGAGVAVYLVQGPGDSHVFTWWDRLFTEFSPATKSVRSRLVAWAAAFEGIRKAPLLGAGPENFILVWSRHFDPLVYHVAGGGVFDRAHNVVVETAATTGLLGLIAYLGMWAAVGRNILRAWRQGSLSAPAASILALGAVSYFVYLLFWFHDHSSFLAFVVLAGLVGHLASDEEAPGGAVRKGTGARGVRSSGSGGDGSGEESGEGGRPPAVGTKDPAGPAAGLPSSVRFCVPALLLAVAAILAWHNVRVLDAARNAWDGEYSMDAWDGVQPYRAALGRGLPGSDPILRAYLRRLGFLANHGDSGSPEGPTPRMKEALAAADRALDDWEDRDPENPRVYVQRSRLCGLKENVFHDGTGEACARRALEHAIELSPEQIRFRHWLADNHLAAGEPDRALEVLDEALRVYGSFGETYYYRARVHWRVDDHAKAVRQARIATSLGWDGQPSPFIQELAGWLAEEGRSAEAARLVEDHLALRYAKLRRPDLDAAPGKGFRPWDLQIAGRLPLFHLRAGNLDAAVRTAEFLAHRLPRSKGPGERRQRVRQFIDDVRSGRAAVWDETESIIQTPSAPEADDPGAGDLLGRDTRPATSGRK